MNSKDDELKICELYTGGATQKEIADIFGVNRRTIGRLLHRVGCPVRSKKEATLMERNGLWKGGKIINKDGYILIRQNRSYKLEHRIVMEKYIGRDLRPEEIVHHINKDTQDNRIENLKLMASNAEHRAEHALPDDQWTKKFDKCIKCGTISRKHASGGLCTRCYVYGRKVSQRGYECEYKDGKRIFSDSHKKKLSQAAICRYNNQ